MNGRTFALAVVPSIALFLGALVPTSAEAACSCSVTCESGSFCSARSEGNNCSCSCSWWSGNARCKGDTTFGLTKQQLREILKWDKAYAMSSRVAKGLGDKPQVRIIHDSLFRASEAQDNDEEAYNAALDTLDDAVLSLSVEDQAFVKETAIQLAAE